MSRCIESVRRLGGACSVLPMLLVVALKPIMVGVLARTLTSSLLLFYQGAAHHILLLLCTTQPAKKYYSAQQL